MEFASIEEGGLDEEETEFFMRFGTIYEFAFNNWVIGPQVNADLVGAAGRWCMECRLE